MVDWNFADTSFLLSSSSRALCRLSSCGGEGREGGRWSEGREGRRGGGGEGGREGGKRVGTHCHLLAVPLQLPAEVLQLALGQVSTRVFVLNDIAVLSHLHMCTTW